jgi:catechol 2,3-dioxygenase-like lactoylglutathione lyase family enzyme
MTIDLGLTHIALPVTDVDRSIQFYAVYAQMQVIRPPAKVRNQSTEPMFVGTFSQSLMISK